MARIKILQTENSRTALTVNPNNRPKCIPEFVAAFLATLSATAAGTCLSWTSAAIPMLQRPGSRIPITDAEGSWIGSLITLGACLGAIPAGSLANFFGRKRLLQILGVPIFLSWMMIAFCPCVISFYAARFLAGLAIGGISVAAPMYVAELAHDNIRGTLGTFFQVQITVGLLIEYILGATIHDFKALALISSVLPVVFLLSFTFMPESPVFLASKGLVEDARKSLSWFRGHQYNVEDELTVILYNIKEASENKTQLSKLINCKATSKGLIISLGLMLFQQLSGINCVLFYTGKIFSEAGGTLSPNTCAILVGFIQVIATLLSTILIDRTGRKLLLFTSAAIMCVCLMTLGIYFNIKQYQDLSHLSMIPLASVGSFIVVFSIGLGPIPWMMMGEIFPPKIKGQASSISASVNWLLAFVVTNQFQNMTSMLGTGITFGIFGIICGIGACFIMFVVPETKGKSVEQVVNELMGSGNSATQYDKCRNVTTCI